MSSEVKAAFVTGVFSLVAVILTYYLTSGSFEKKIDKEYVSKSSASADSIRFRNELNKCRVENERLSAALGVSIHSDNRRSIKTFHGLQAEVLEIKGDASNQRVEVTVKVTNVAKTNQMVSGPATFDWTLS